MLGAAELEAVREAFETGGLEAALSWVRAGLERLGSARWTWPYGRADVGLVLDVLGLDPEDPVQCLLQRLQGPRPARPQSAQRGALGACLSSAIPLTVSPYPTTHYDALILGPPWGPH